MNRAKWTLLLILLISLNWISLGGGPVLVVKIVKDDLVQSKTCILSIMKDGSFKSMDKKYILKSYDFYVLNYRGETKWYKSLEKAEVDLSDFEELEIVKGDLIVIENAIVVNRKTGEVIKLNHITERYLVR